MSFSSARNSWRGSADRDKKKRPPRRGTSAQRCYRWGGMGTVHDDLLNRQNDARGILVAGEKKRRPPHKGGRRPNDTLVGGVWALYTMTC